MAHRSSEGRRTRLPGKWAIALLSVGLSLVLAGAYNFAISYEFYQPKPFNRPALNRAVAWVLANGGGSKDGVMPLPPALASVSANGNAYVMNGLVFFPSLFGRKTLLPDPLINDDEIGWIEGYGFSATRLTTEEEAPVGSDDFFINMDFSEPAHAPDGYFTNQMAVGQRIDAQWYRIDSFS